jgi:hypothetical protein
MKRLAWVLCFLPVFAGCDFEDRAPIDMATVSQSQTLDKEKSLDATVRLDIGSLEISSEKHAGILYSYDLLYDKAGFAPDLQYNPVLGGTDGRLFFSLRNIRRTGIHPQRSNSKLRVAFGNSIPLSLKINAGVGDARLSLSSLKISRLDFESGVGEAKISSYELNPISCEYIKLKNGIGRFEAVGLGYLNFRNFEFDGGVGGASLDFSGEWKQNADIRIQVGVGEVNVRMPREIGVKVDSPKNFLSGVHLDGFSKQDSYYYSENYDRASIRVSIRVTTGIGGLSINWI